MPGCPYLYTCENRVPLWHFNTYCIGEKYEKCKFFQEMKAKSWKKMLERDPSSKTPREWMFQEVVE